MNAVRAAIRNGFDRTERLADRAFGADWNPLSQLGPLGWFLFWTVAISGIYLFIFFDTSVTHAYASVEWMTTDHWWHAGLVRSLHRYASDLMVLVMLIHMVREWAMDRYRGKRWFSWFTGIPVMWFIYLSGITGYWLVWDQLAQYVALNTTELLDASGLFAEPIARNFLSPEALSSRFFTLMVFLHIAIPLLLLMLMLVHIQRISEARTRPPRGLAFITFSALVVVSLLIPATSQGPADLAEMPQRVGIDWLLLPLYPLIQSVPAGFVWAGVFLFTLLLASLPWLPPRREGPAAEVFLDHCNGCARCVADCPYTAITLVPRTDDLPFRFQAEVDPDRCVSCGICMGSCPSSTPFRRHGPLITGIDLPDPSLAEVRAQVIVAAEAIAHDTGRVLTLACGHGAAAAPASGRVIMPCVAMAPPSLIDYIISRDLADGVAIAGCAERDCYNRHGAAWTKARFSHQRDPYLRERVPRERVATIWAGPTEKSRLQKELSTFAERLAQLPSYEFTRPLDSVEAEAARSGSGPDQSPSEPPPSGEEP